MSTLNSRGNVTFVVDAFWGSSGKGKLSTWLADQYGRTAVSSSNFPNAGHTAIVSGHKFVAKAIPTALILASPTVGKLHRMTGYLSAGSGFTLQQLATEVGALDARADIFIHERAVVVNDLHAAGERSSMRHIASTMQGSGAALMDKIARASSDILAGSWRQQIESMSRGNTTLHVVSPAEFRSRVAELPLLHEVAQGFALSLDHGTHYPQCTSRNCSVPAALDQLGLPPKACDTVWLNVRSFPIRVGNLYDENGREEGHSGGFLPDQIEMTWDRVGRDAGMTAETTAKLAEQERTTVTKRVRRVATLSYQWVEEAARANGATHICLSFPQYNDVADHELRHWSDLTRETRRMIDRLEATTGIPVAAVSTGADHDDMAINESRMP